MEYIISNKSLLKIKTETNDEIVSVLDYLIKGKESFYIIIICLRARRSEQAI